MEYIYKKIAGIYFGLLSPKQIKKMAGVKIVTPELYDKEGYPVDGGLMDTRLGVIDPGIRCKTCGEKLKECPGHFGYIELARPIIHIKYIPIIYDLLRSTCMECSRVLLSEERCQEKISKKEVKALKTVSKCPRCETKQTKIKLEKPTTFVEGDVRLSPIEIQARLEKIPNDDL
ncbi:MAG TPA: DNA-directed RNA polymerase subunit A', partial [Candidatus Nanoarchaeia archaeon]|nr:DNA-directed RNA polymerase subunit A' [Candidatus Nanoarchaeia archaeon]